MGGLEKGEKVRGKKKDTKKVVVVRLTEEEFSLINEAFLVSFFRNKREFYRVIARCFSEAVRKTVNFVNKSADGAFCGADGLNSLSEEEKRRLIDFVKAGIFHKDSSVSLRVSVKGDDEALEFMKRNFVLGWLVKSCIIHAARKIIENNRK